jgi:autotransporter adhesin
MRFAAISTGTTSANAAAYGVGSSAGANSSAFGAGAVANGPSSPNGAGGSAFGYNALAFGAADTAVGAGAQVRSDNGTAVGANSLIDAGVQSGTAIGAGAHLVTGANNSVALGANSVATEADTVSVGSAGNTRRITNVSPGVNPTDAATVGQLDTVASGLNTLQAGLNQANKHIAIADGGVAMGMAMSVAPLSLNTGEQGISGGVATFEGRSALGFRYQGQPTARITVGLGVGIASGSSVGASAGVGFKF